jgi:hypothetical protein
MISRAPSVVKPSGRFAATSGPPGLVRASPLGAVRGLSFRAQVFRRDRWPKNPPHYGLQRISPFIEVTPNEGETARRGAAATGD